MRSTRDRDTHRGRYSRITRSVHTVCGIEFVPRPLAGYRGALAFPGQPPDPEQACVTCRQSEPLKPGAS